MLDRDEDHAPADQAGATEEVSTDEEIWGDFDAEEAEAADASADEADEDSAEDFKSVTNEAPPDDDEDGADDDQKQEQDGEAAKPLTYEQLAEKSEKLEQKLRSERGRSAGQQRRADRLAQELTELRKRKNENPEAAEKSRQELAKKLADSEQEYGDVIGPIAEAMRDMQSRMDQLTESEKRQLAAKEVELNEALDAEWQVLLNEHPDGVDVVKQNEKAFAAWINDQPAMYREIAQKNARDIYDGAGAALIISRFKMALAEADGRGPNPNAPQTSRRQRQLAGSRTVRGSGRQAVTSDIPPADAPDEVHWEFFERQERKKARTQGW